MEPDPGPPVHVVAAVLHDALGRILLSRRPASGDLAGLWEFPGGKVEPGEAPAAALRRELKEELGIVVDASEPLIVVPHAYPHKRILLDVHRVTSFEGNARGLESQALAWVPPDKVPNYAMPGADRPVVAALLQPDRYLITPAPDSDDAAFLQALARALDAGVRRVQLRLGPVTAARSRGLAEHAQYACVAAGAELLLNSANPDAIGLADELGLGLHLTATHLRAIASRPIASGRPLAASCHDVEELQLAQALECDFAVLGAVALTPSHPGREPMGWQRFARLREAVSLPIYALGGLGPEDFLEARAHGAQGIAAIRALWSSDA